MTLLYRAIWTDDREDLIEVARATMGNWLAQQKGWVVDVAEPETLYSTPQRDSTVTTAIARFGKQLGLRSRLLEVVHDTGDRWITTLTVIADEARAGGTVWVDLERTSRDPFSRPQLHVPNLVRDLIHGGIDGGGRPRIGHVPLLRGVAAIDGVGLAGLIRNQDREISIAVFSHDDVRGFEATKRRADAAYKRLLGIAQVYLLAPDQLPVFNERMGTDLGVWGGAARLYLPNRDSRGLTPERHRYVPAHRMGSTDAAAAEAFSVLLSPLVTGAQPPDGYDELRPQFVGAGKDESELLALALEETETQRKEIDQLRAQLASFEDENLDLRGEIEELSAEVSRKSNDVAIAYMSTGRGDVTTAVEMPSVVESITEAVELAARLPRVVVHPDALRDIEKLESSVSSGAWANTIWRALRALDSYALNSEQLRGGFFEWCKHTKSAFSWPATDKKLSMTESEQVLHSARLRGCRMLPVDTRVDTSGFIEMLAHMKIAEGGGPLAPRIYFYDDREGSTGAVHVGFIGPHEHMPNKSTN